MSDNIIGKVSVDVYPNTKGFRQQLQAQLESIEKSLNDLAVGMELDAEDLIAEAKANVEAAEKAAGDIKVGMELDRDQALRQIKDMEDELSELRFHPKFDEMAAKRVRRDMEDLILKREDLKVKVDAELEPLKKRRLLRDLGDVEESLYDIDQKVRDVNRGLARTHSGFAKSVGMARRLSSSLDGLSENVGRGFGKGSRNNFLNFLGVRVAALTAAFTGILKAPTELLSILGKSVGMFRELTDQGVSTGAALAKSLGSGLAAATTSMLSLGVAAASAVFLLGSMAIIAPMVSMLAGAFIALAGSITIALLGALMPIIPIIAALALGLGVAAAAFVPLIEDIKEGKGEFAGAAREIDKLKGSVKRLGESVAPSLGRLAETFTKGANALVKSFAPAVKRVFDDLDKKLRSPSMDKFYDQWRTKMPRIFENFGAGLNSLGVALTAFFAPVLGFAEDLSKSFKDNMDRFSEWARSAEGQNSIADFLEKARDRGSKLWNIIKDIGGGFWNMMSVGDEKVGNDILSYLEDVADKFEQWTRKPMKLSDMVDMGIDPGTAKASGVKGINRNEQSGLQSFMDDVREFSASMKTTAEEVGAFFRKLNSPQNREAANQVALWIAGISGALSGVADAASFSVGPLLAPFAMIEGAIKRIKDLNIDWGAIFNLQNLPAIDIAAGIIDGIISGLQSAPGRILAAVILIPMMIVDTIAKFLGIQSPSTVMIGLMLDVGAGIVAGLLMIPGMILGALLTVATAIVNGFKDIPEKVATALAPLKDKVGSAITSAKSAATGKLTELVNSGVGVVGMLPGRAGSALAPLASRLGGEVNKAKSSSDGGFTRLVSSGVSLASALPGRVGSAISSLSSTVSGVVSKAWGSAASATRAGVSTVASASAALRGAVMAQMSGLASSMAGVGADIVNGLAAGIAANAGRAAAAAASMAASALSAAKAALASRSPSKKFIQLGKDSVAGYVIGVVKNARKAIGVTSQTMSRSVRAGSKTLKKTSRKELVKAGEVLAKGLEIGLRSQSGNVRKAIKDLGKEVRNVSNPRERAKAMGLQKALSGDMKLWDQLNEKHKHWLKIAQDLRKEKAAFAESMVNDALSIAGLGNIEGGFNEIIHRLTTAKEMTTEFAKHLATLRKNGLRKDLYEQIAALGPEAGMGAAKALAEAGKKGVKQVNDLQKDLLGVSSKLGDDSASHLYDSGIKMATSVANGFRTQMRQVEKDMAKTARKLANVINRQLKADGFSTRVSFGPSAVGSKKGYYTPISSGTQNVLNYYAAPGSSMSEQESLFKAFRKAGFK